MSAFVLTSVLSARRDPIFIAREDLTPEGSRWIPTTSAEEAARYPDPDAAQAVLKEFDLEDLFRVGVL